MQSFLQEYDLSSAEGVLLMCVAEALLRIPDAATADKLIRDKLSQGDWEQHVGRNHSLLVNAGTWGMMLTGRLVSLEPEGAQGAGAWLARLAARAGEPVVRMALRQGMKLMAEQFVMGRTIERRPSRAAATDDHTRAIATPTTCWARRPSPRPMPSATSTPTSRRSTRSRRTRTSASRAAARSRARTSPSSSRRCTRATNSRSASACSRSSPPASRRSRSARARGDIGVTLDAEEADRLELSLDIFERVFASAPLAGWEGFGLAVQAYQKRAPFVIDWLADLARRARPAPHGAPREGRVLGHRGEARAGAGPVGLPGVHAQVQHRRVLPRVRAAQMLAAPDAFYGQFATHNAHTVATILERAGGAGRFEFQRLHGMGEELYERGASPRATPAACTRRWEATRTCCPISCAACSRTAPTPRS